MQEIGSIKKLKRRLDARFLVQETTKSAQMVMADKRGSYISSMHLFDYHFNCIPNLIEETNIDVPKAHGWFLEQFEVEIKEQHYSKMCYHKSKTAQLDDCLYALKEDFLVYFDFNQSEVSFLFKKTENSLVEQVVNKINTFKKRKVNRKAQVEVLVNSMQGLESKAFPLKKPKLAIADNYNADFLPIHQSILTRLRKKNDKGLVLLHGKSGTGKTTYLRYLAGLINKPIIFMPPNMAANITGPDLLAYLVEYPGSVLIIEDAENIVTDREQRGNSPVSALLNLSDGLLSDCLNIQIICSFNTDISKVDRALLRKGRLIAKYEFKALEINKAQALSDSLGYKNTIKAPTKLSDIYNQNDASFEEQPSVKIGFENKMNHK